MRIEIPADKKIIVLTGPESSGKTTLANRLSIQYKLPLVEEYARTYLEENGPDYTLQDIFKIAKEQIAKEERVHSSYPLIICDTDLITLEIWVREKYKTSLEISDHLIAKKIYLLCKPDIPWQPDPLRENPKDRHRLFEVYQTYLQQNKLDYVILNQNDRNTIQLKYFSLD